MDTIEAANGARPLFAYVYKQDIGKHINPDNKSVRSLDDAGTSKSHATIVDTRACTQGGTFKFKNCILYRC